MFKIYDLIFQESFLNRLKEEENYECGDNFPDDCGFTTKRSLRCTTEVEVNYYGASLRGIRITCCIFCAKQDDLLVDTDPYIEKLYESFSVVRPICRPCRQNEQEAKTSGMKFIRGKKPKKTPKKLIQYNCKFVV